ncbi:MAG: hypothetical protein ACQR33_06810 [Candidatus Saccharibacteria bacterium]
MTQSNLSCETQQLCAIAATGQYLFHGTNLEYPVLYSSIPHWNYEGNTYPDSDIPVVCAMDKPLVPTFMGLIAVTNARPCRSLTNELGGKDFAVPTRSRESLEQAVGFVAILSRDLFELVEDIEVPAGYSGPRPGGRRAEWRSYAGSLEPVGYVSVTFDDFLGLLSTAPESTFRFMD